MKKTITKLSLVLASVALSATSALAHFGSKGPYGGGTVTSSVVKGDTIYVGTSNGGVYQSLKLGSWSAKNVGLKSGQIVSLAHTGKYAIAATADSGIFRFSGYSGTDRYWVKINNGISNLDLTSVIAVTDSVLLAGTSNGQLFKSTNIGNTWSEITNLPFAGSKIVGLTIAGSRVILLSETKGVFYSDTKGSSWSSLNDVNTSNKIGGNAFSYNSTTDELLIKNADGFFILTSAKSVTTATYSSVIGLNSSDTLVSLSNNETTWFASTVNGVFSSVAGTIAWNKISLGLPTTTVNVVIPFTTNIVAGTINEGIYTTTTSSIAWTAFNTGFSNLKTNSFASNGTNLIYVATEKGVFVTKDLATNYARANKGLTDSLHVNDLVIFGSKVFAVTENAGVFVSADSGKVWNPFNTGLSNANYVNVYASKNFLYVIDDATNVYQSNGTSAWTSIQKGLPIGVEYYVFSFFNDKVYAAAHGGGVFWKNEASGDWNDITKNLPTTHTTAVTLLGTKIYVGTHHEGVFVSDIKSINWVPTAKTSIDHTVLMGLDGDGIQAMATYGGYVFASYKGGLLATSDEGKTWQRGGNQFNLPSFTDVNKIGFAGERVFVTTENNCIWSNALSEVPLNVAFATVKPSACDNSGGALCIAFTGGTSYTAPAAPYKIKWSTGDTVNLSLTNLSAGIYWVQITDKLGATSNDSIVLEREACPNLIVKDTNIVKAACNNLGGGVELKIEGGLAPYKIKWNTNDSVSKLTNLAAGIYTVVVTDKWGTASQDTVKIEKESCTEINELTSNQSISIYPNPTKSTFTITSSELISRVQIYNELGALVKEISPIKATNMDMNIILDKGVYLLYTTSNEVVNVQKLIIE